MDSLDTEADRLKRSLRDALDGQGVLEPIKARIRSAVFNALDGACPGELEGPQPSAEMILINQLLLEYLEFHGMECTASVFRSEACGLASGPVLPRSVMALELGLPGAPPSVPLLYSLLNECRKKGAVE